MFDEFEFKSYAERKFVQDVFEYGDEVAELMENLDSDENSTITNVNVGKWCIEYEDKNDSQKVEDGESSDGKDTGDGKVKATPIYKIPTILSVKNASTICRKYLRYQHEQGKIFDSQAIPSSKKIRTALIMFGYNQTTKNIVRDGIRSSLRVYENIAIKPEWIEKLNLESLVKSIEEDEI